MAKSFVRISLATKFRLLFGGAVLAIIAAALLIPWYFMELLAQQNLQLPAEELTRLRMQEWIQMHPTARTAARGPAERPEGPVGPDQPGDWVGQSTPLPVGELYSRADPAAEGRKMLLYVLTAERIEQQPLDAVAKRARRAFMANRDLEVTVLKDETNREPTVYRGLRSIRMVPSCDRCHGGKPMDVRYQFPQGQLVAMVDVWLPKSLASTPLVLWTRVAFLVGGSLATVLAFVLFVLLTQRLVLRPIRQLTDMADRVADGDMVVRSTIQTGDELQRLGESFNDMLEAITDQTDKLRRANRALDLKLSELAQANVSLFQANQVKTDFLTNVSHELRTPLNSIIGFADLISEQAGDRVARWAQNISVASKNLLAIINDLLDLAKIEAGRATINLDKVAISDTCQTLLDLMKPQADQKQIRLIGQIDPDLPILNTDGGKIQQILYNLLSNAIKFTTVGGQVELSAKFSRRGETDPGQVVISVADTGPGIAEADQQRIFDKFYQLDKPLTKQSAGTGLGLAISRELSNLLGGRLTVKSKPGQGATFTFALPVDAEPASA
ncbi:MAG: ATP-binding protein [Phycisphaerae bacterium]